MTFDPLPTDVLQIGLVMVRVDYKEHTYEKCNILFNATYGSSSQVLSQQWFQLCRCNTLVHQLSERDMTEEGFQFFLRAHYFLWVYPRNEYVFATHFDVSPFYCRGKFVWNWISRIADLKSLKIVLDEEMINDPSGPSFATTFDLVDFKVNEPKHEEFPYNKAYYSHKHAKSAFRYLFSLQTFHPKCILIAGPYPAGSTSEVEIFRKHLKPHIHNNKMCICDGGIKTGELDEKMMLSVPNNRDSKEFAKFKARARCRMEAFNGRVRNFDSMDHCFRHGMPKHKLACTAVAVTVQYQLDNGALLFDAM